MGPNGHIIIQKDFMTNSVNINYVIITCFEKRRDLYKKYLNDKFFYIKKHLEILSIIKHNLSQITVVANRLNNKLDQNDIDTIKNLIQKPYKLFIRNNIGGSYGAFKYINTIYSNKFDYYFFMEDDYVPILNDFDALFLKQMHRQNCDYLALKVDEDHYDEQHSRGKHASISIGLLSNESIKSFDYNSLIDNRSKDLSIKYIEYSENQFIFSNEILKNGFLINKINGYGLKYWAVDRLTILKSGQEIITPIQSLN